MDKYNTIWIYVLVDGFFFFFALGYEILIIWSFLVLVSFVILYIHNAQYTRTRWSSDAQIKMGLFGHTEFSRSISFWILWYELQSWLSENKISISLAAIIRLDYIN